MKRLSALLWCVLLIPLASAAQVAQLHTEEDARAVSDEVMERVVRGDYEAAFEQLRSYWPFASAELDALLDTTVAQRTQVAPRFGKSLGHTLIRSRTVEESLLELVYMEKTERHALRWVFLFYKPHDRWILNNIEWNDDIDALFDER